MEDVIYPSEKNISSLKYNEIIQFWLQWIRPRMPAMDDEGTNRERDWWRTGWEREGYKGLSGMNEIVGRREASVLGVWSP